MPDQLNQHSAPQLCIRCSQYFQASVDVKEQIRENSLN